MMKALAVTLLGAAMLAAAPAQAQVLDLSTIKCKDFVESGKENIGVILAWMNAYYKGEDDPPIIDFDKMAQDGRKLGEKCAANPTMGLMTAADSLFEQ
jgi:acid stress chaperone HdeB